MKINFGLSNLTWSLTIILSFSRRILEFGTLSRCNSFVRVSEWSLGQKMWLLPLLVHLLVVFVADIIGFGFVAAVIEGKRTTSLLSRETFCSKLTATKSTKRVGNLGPMAITSKVRICQVFCRKKHNLYHGDTVQARSPLDLEGYHPPPYLAHSVLFLGIIWLPPPYHMIWPLSLTIITSWVGLLLHLPWLRLALTISPYNWPPLTPPPPAFMVTVALRKAVT